MKESVKKSECFSVLMSVYIKEKPEYLDESLNSVMDLQTVKPDEVLLVEDGEITEDLKKVINKYKKKYPNILKSVPLEKNLGLGLALQKGLEECKYDLIMRMDTDDVCMPDRFEKQLKYMNEHKDTTVVGGTIGEFLYSPEEELRIKTMPLTYEDVLNYSKFRNPLNHMTVCFRKKDILEVGNYQPMLFLEDQYLWSRLLIAGKRIENMPDLLVKARIGNGFYKRRGAKNYIKGWKELQNYLYKNSFINRFQKFRNICGMYVMVYSPNWVRQIMYNKVLRRG